MSHSISKDVGQMLGNLTFVVGMAHVKAAQGEITTDEASKRTQQEVEVATNQLTLLLEKAALEARMIELDLFEQFMNQRENKGITRGDLYGFKMQRLKDLETRLEALNKVKE